jgi:RimJ/RimL family protein N-acetyltransferase
VEIRLAALTTDDAAAQCAGEDEATVRWLTGGYGTVEGTQDYFRMLADNAQAGRGKRGFGVWLDGRLAGYVDCDPDLTDGLEDGDVNISFGVHPWARGRGVAGEAVRLMCDFLREQRLGTRAALRIEPENSASIRVAEKGGFTFIRQFVSTTDTHPDGSPAVMNLYRRDL